VTDCERCAELAKELKEAERMLKAITDTCVVVSQSTAAELSTGNHPRGYWSRKRGQADMAATILQILGKSCEIKQIKRVKPGLFGGLFRGLKIRQDY
jgi:hypothetical protein